MGLKCGIVGLPNVGKSTLFNALTQAAAEASNYPFCTIEPNQGVVKVPDSRLEELAGIVDPEKIIPTIVEFVDIAGLVKGASRGEGLGNKFLGHIKEVDAIVHVLRCFEDTDVVHVHGNVEPLRDADIIETELILRDLDTLDNRLAKRKKGALGKEKEEADFLFRVKELLEQGKWLRRESFNQSELEILEPLCLISMKHVLYVLNVSESEVGAGAAKALEAINSRSGIAEERAIVLCSQIEAEISQLESAEERLEFLESLGLEESGLDHLIRTAYELLGLRTFFTAGPKEVRAWTVPAGATAPQGAGVIHTDFEKGFIRAEIVSYDDFVQCRGEQGARDKGLLRVEGKEYILQNGDVVHFRFQV
ncbi:redox-regulated ATPase YchF [bacterium]|jgi:ribosome-binding ATPase|nr:redox-regulated ATPase YchF [bacterium]